MSCQPIKNNDENINCLPDELIQKNESCNHLELSKTIELKQNEIHNDKVETLNQIPDKFSASDLSDSKNENNIDSTNDDVETLKIYKFNKESQIHSKLTEQFIKDSGNFLMESSKNDSVLEYLNSVEPTEITIHEKLIDINDSESEEDDQLKPLIMDNHSNTDQQEFYVCANHPDNISGLPSYDEIIKDATSSNESDLSTQYDHRDLTTFSHNSDDLRDPDLDFITLNQQKRPPLTTTPNSGVPDIPEIKEIDTLTSLEIPDDRLCEEIVEQVEFYFSDESILKDAFLLKHVRRNKEGFVSLKLVSSFKRVRQFTKDWRVVGHAVRRKSKKIELNILGTKIRRIESLPTFDETMPSRTIVCSDFPFPKLCVEKVTDVFSKYGEIALIRILRPGMVIPVDVRQFMNKYPEMQQKECALIEYIDSHSARTAKELTDNCIVFDMVAPKKKTGKKSITTITKFIENYQYPDNNYEKNRGGHRQDNFNNQYEIDYRHDRPRRNSSEYYIKPEQQTHNFIYQPPHMPVRRHSANAQENNQHIMNMQNINMMHGNINKHNNNNNNINFNHYPPRGTQNYNNNNNNNNNSNNNLLKTYNEHNNNIMPRKYSSQSEGYSSCSEGSRRTSLCSTEPTHQRILTNCSEHCPCSRRSSQCSDLYRKISQCSDNSNNSRRYSNESFHNYDRNYSNPNDNNNIMMQGNRRISVDSNYERKLSSDSMHGNGNGPHHFYENPFRKYSNGFDPFRKLSNSDQYYNGRRISTDSGYDRKLSFGSDYSTSTSPRSRTTSFVGTCPHSKVDTVVRTPIGPDGSKGFASRMRKIGQTIVPPVI